jgi:GR25 family glycosyltransferase involved in LPS biosynthesis
MLRIGVTYNPSKNLFYSGSNQTALVLYELFSKLKYEVLLIDSKNGDDDWWSDYPKPEGLVVNKIYKTRDLDILIDIDGYVDPKFRKQAAKSSIVFLRNFVQFTEMDNSVYPENPYIPRSFEGVKEIWCWDILNPHETIPSIQTLFPCPIRTVPFIWSSKIASHYSKNMRPQYNLSNKEWTVHITEKNTNTSSSIIPLVATRELTQKNIINAKFICHNMMEKKDNKFCVENVLNNIEISKIPLTFEEKEPYYKWLEKHNQIQFSHSRFVPIKIGLLNSVWMGIPLIHNSPILKDIHPELEKTFYFGNDIKQITNVFYKYIHNPKNIYLAQEEIQAQIIKKWSVDSNLDRWHIICEIVLQNKVVQEKVVQEKVVQEKVVQEKVVQEKVVQEKVVQEKVLQNKEVQKLVVGFSDMWPGFNCNSNFITDALRFECKQMNLELEILGIEYQVEHNCDLLIFGPYGTIWKQIPNTIPKVYFSGENWPYQDDNSIKLYMTSSRQEDDSHIRIPTWMMYIDWYSDSKILPEACEDNPIRLPLHFATTSHPISFKDRKNFCAFVVSNPVCEFRNESFKAVNEYKTINSGGALFNNIGGQLSLKYAGGGCGDISKYKFFSEHQFTISFENSQAPGYITEKVLHSKMAGCVPIYWGDNQTDSDFTPNSFINISNTSNPQKVVEVIKLLEKNEHICNVISSTPILDKERVKKALHQLSVMSRKLLKLAKKIDENKIELEGLEKVYLVNLDTRPDRLENLYKDEPNLKEIVTRIPAVNGKTLQMTDTIYDLFKKNNFNWKKSAMGCSLSHMTIWSLIAKQLKGNYYLVIEDDVRFNKNFYKSWSKYAKSIPADAELLYIGGVLPPNKPALKYCLQPVNECWSEIKPNTFFTQVQLPVFHFCTFSYIISRKGAEKMLRFLRDSDEKSYAAVDHLLGSPHVNLKTYVSNELLANCFQENDPAYVNSQFNAIDRTDNFDSDIWNNKECFTEDELAPFKNKKNSMTFYYIYENREYELYEKKWLEEVFNKNITFKPLINYENIVEDGSWFIVQRPHVQNFNRYFELLNNKKIGFKVLHLSDEFSQDNLSFYKLAYCKGVIRNYIRSDVPKLGHIITIPLGFHHKGEPHKSFDDRKLVWSFHGNSWFNRQKLLSPIYTLIPHHCHFVDSWDDPKKTSENDYLSKLNSSKFCPILRGNNIETFRLYEAVECGTIPIYVRCQGDEQFWDLIQSRLELEECTSWDEAIIFINKLLSDSVEAERYKVKVIKNWKCWKESLKLQCNALM